MKELVFLLEEPSAEVLVNTLAPKLLPADVRHRCLVFEGNIKITVFRFEDGCFRKFVKNIRPYR